MLGPRLYVFDAVGAKNAARVLRFNEWWRLLTPMLLHGGWIHLIGNLLVQLQTGAMLEAMWGHTAWLLIYITSGAYGSLASCVVFPDRIGVGSSGALCGLIGAWLVFIPITWNQTLPLDVKMRNARFVTVGVSVFVIVGLSFLPLMDYAAHFGGLAMGISMSMAIFASRLQHRGWCWGTRLGGFALLASLTAGMLAWFLDRTKVYEPLLHVCPVFHRC